MKWVPLAAFLMPLPLLALDIEGVQMASLDQPRVTVMLQRGGEREPLSAKQNVELARALGLEAGEKSISFAAFLDTGASGISISTQTADALGIRRLKTPGAQTQIVFHDVGVAGSDRFHVSEPLLISLGSYQALGAAADATSFKPAGGPWSCQVGPLGGGGLLGALIGGIDIVGMPVMAGKVVVIDARPVNSFSDTLRVQLLNPGENAERLPQTQRHVILSYGDFAPYTRVEPADARKPVLTANPFIGPAPTARPEFARRSPPVVMNHQGKSASGAWLLDTGAAASIISKAQAEKLGVRYKAGSESQLEGVPQDRQFTLTIGGIGGQKKSAGFYVDELRIPTSERDELIYKQAPLLVADITVKHPQTHESLTLDGILGMNFLVASAQVTEGLLPDIGKMTQGPYDFIIIDHAQGVMGLSLRKELR